MRIRDATPGEMTAVGEVRVAAYRAGGFISADSGYTPTLRGLGADGNGHVLVAVASVNGGQAGNGDAGTGAVAADRAQQADRGDRVLGTIMLQTWPQAGPVVARPDEAEIRALAVRPDIQGQGVGRQLLQHAVQRAARLGIRHLVLCTEPAMRAAHHLYQQAGFVRLPERDWSPGPGVTLLVYGLRLDQTRPRT